MALFAHQGGWDEILLVLAPIVVIAALVRLVQHRSEHAASHQGGADGPTTDQSS